MKRLPGCLAVDVAQNNSSNLSVTVVDITQSFIATVTDDGNGCTMKDTGLLAVLVVFT